MMRKEPVTQTEFQLSDSVPLRKKAKDPDLVNERWRELRLDAADLLAEAILMDPRTRAVSFHEDSRIEPDLQIERLTLTVRVALMNEDTSEQGRNGAPL